MFVTVKEASAALNLPASTLYKLAASGEIACKRVGRSVYLLKSSLDQWAQCEARAPSRPSLATLAQLVSPSPSPAPASLKPYRW